jgi:hypothetical protein
MEFDETSGRALLQPLIREPTAPSAVDLGRAIRDGERRIRVARLAGGVATATLVVVAAAVGTAAVGSTDDRGAADAASAPPTAQRDAPPAPPPPRACSVEFLPVPAGLSPTGSVTGGDPTGRYLVGMSSANPDPGQPRTVLIWDNRQPRAVDIPGRNAALLDINAAGTAVGISGGDRPTAWVYQNGQVARLTGTDAEARAINGKGIIVGSVQGRPAMWRSPTSEPTMLKMLDGAQPDWTGRAFGVDEDGTVAGAIVVKQVAVGRPGQRTDVTSLQSTIGVVWSPDGKIRRIPAPPQNAGDRPLPPWYMATDIRGGWAVGMTRVRPDNPREGVASHPRSGVRWNLRTATVAIVANGVQAVNRHGWTVGTDDGSGVLITDRGAVPLPAPDDALRNGADARTISDDGRTVAGQAVLSDRISRPVVWTCG